MKWSSLYKKSKYSDEKWKYEADSEKGVKIRLTCPCGQTHTLKLDKNMAVLAKEEVIDIEDSVDLISYNGLSEEVGYEGQNRNLLEEE